MNLEVHAKTKQRITAVPARIDRLSTTELDGRVFRAATTLPLITRLMMTAHGV